MTKSELHNLNQACCEAGRLFRQIEQLDQLKNADAFTVNAYTNGSISEWKVKEDSLFDRMIRLSLQLEKEECFRLVDAISPVENIIDAEEINENEPPY